jgi:hypothetical protein
MHGKSVRDDLAERLVLQTPGDDTFDGIKDLFRYRQPCSA